jgi:predicted PurR-regulated permease PerM
VTSSPGPDRATPSVLVPSWLERLAALGWRVLAIVAMGVVLLGIAVSLPTATATTLLALVLAASLSPTVAGLRRRFSRTIAALIACLIGGVVIVGGVVLVLAALVPDALAIVSAVTRGLADVREQVVALGVPELAIRTYDRVVDAVLALFSLDLGAVAESVVAIGTVLVLGTFLTFFLLQDGDRGWAWAVNSLAPWRGAAVTASATAGVDRVAWYLRRTVALATLDAVIVGAVLSIAGVPLAAGLAAVALLAGLVPYLGAILGAGIIGLATLALGGPGAAIAVLVALGIGSVAATRLLDGTRIGRQTDVHPIVVLFALPTGAALLGLLGLIVALPTTVFLVTIGRSLVRALDLEPAGPATAPQPPTAAAPGTRAVPVWLDRLAQWSWRGLVAAGLAFVAIQLIVRIPTVIVPAVIALVSAATLLPLVDRLAARGWSRGAAAAVSTVGVAIAIVVTVGVAFAMTAGVLADVLDTALEGARLTEYPWLVRFVQEIEAGATLDLGRLLAATFGLVLFLVLAFLLTFFFLRDGHAAWAHAMARVPPGRRTPLDEAGRRSVDVLAGYMLGTAVISAFGGFTSGLIMVLLGLPLALPIAVLTFFLSFIPYVGGAVTTALAFLIAVAVGEPSDIVIMAVYTVVFNIVQGSFVAPIVYGNSLRLHPAVVLMAVPVGGEIAGMLGMFLVVPIVAIVSATWVLVRQAIDDDGPTGDERRAIDEDAPVEQGSPLADPAPEAAPAPG